MSTKRAFPGHLNMVCNREDLERGKAQGHTLIVLDQNCSHCQNLYLAMCTQGLSTDQVSLITQWEDESSLEELLDPLPRPVAFPHAIDLKTGGLLTLRLLLQSIDIKL